MCSSVGQCLNQLGGLDQGVIVKDAEFEAAAAKVDDATSLNFRAEPRKQLRGQGAILPSR